MATVVDKSGNSPIGNGVDNELEEVSASGVGSPYGVLTPDFAGQIYLRTSNQHLYKAHGITNTDWVLQTPTINL